MASIIDLTLPVKKHWRWTFNKTIVFDFKSGGPLLDEMLYMDVHSFTHMDPPAHAFAGRANIDQIPLADVIGEAKIIDLVAKPAATEITADDLNRGGSHVAKGDIVILKTCQGQKADWETPEYWNTSPWLGRSGAQWLIDKGVKTVAFDFTQEYIVREFFRGAVPTLDEMYIHKMLLGADIIMVEYIANMHLVQGDRVQFFAVPLNLAGIAGAPARAFAIQ